MYFKGRNEGVKIYLSILLFVVFVVEYSIFIFFIFHKTYINQSIIYLFIYSMKFEFY